ncbi:MAG: sigma-70 family RNA polymerase sigma factor [Candidatus Dormiibacterota bacterium]
MDAGTATEKYSATSFLTSEELEDADSRVAEIYVAHYQHLVGLASMLAGGRAFGEEIAQETFMVALEHERRYPGYLTEPVWPWLRITAVRLAGRLRKRLLRDILLILLRDNEPATPAVGSDETIDVLRALRRLPPKMRLCVILSHVEDQSTASIATMLGCSTQNVDSQLRKGRRRLRTILGDDYNNQ